MDHQREMELLAPAGDQEGMRAAVANGADAVYFGLANFNARHRAGNLEGDTLKQTIDYLHAHNVRGYVAFNTLAFSDELEQAVGCIRDIAESGADAVIVQDTGILHLIALIAPSLPRHASTQMTLTDARGIEAATRLGVSRAILARELSVADVAKITSQTTTPVEVFCHGALCVAYSGQCLTSESIGGRSANRGQCAQACRLPYEIRVDGRPADQAGRQFLLSPQDLAAYDKVAELLEAKVASLKIEGRLKSAQYVAATTAAYRESLEAALAGRKLQLSKQREAQLTQSFSRGFSHGFLDGVNHQALVLGTFSKKRGVQLGEVADTSDEAVLVRLRPGQMVKPGDGIVFDEGHPEQDEQGGRVYELKPKGKGLVELRFGRGFLATSAISHGAMVWKTDDPAINRELAQSYRRDVVAHREKLRCEISAVAGLKLRITLRDAAGNGATVESEAALELSRKFPLDENLVREQLGRLGDTPFELGEVVIHGRTVEEPGDGVMVPKSVLNELRRSAIAQLLETRSRRRRHEVSPGDVLGELRQKIATKYGAKSQGNVQMTVLVRTLDQLRAAIAWWSSREALVPMIWCDFEDVRRYSEAVQVARAAGAPVGLATMRVNKPSEDGFLKIIVDARPDAVLVRNLSALAYMSQQDGDFHLVGDYSLNVANEISAYVLLEGKATQGRVVERLTPSHDLNAAQLEAMLAKISGEHFEVVVHQHMPMFHMEHCVFAHMLSNGRDFHDCGRPCEKHKVTLRDRVGIEHPLQADAGCRNTLFNGRAQSASAYVPKLRELGVRHFRVELLQENERQTQELLTWYAAVLASKGAGASPRPKLPLKVLNLMGVTPGTLEFE